MTEPLTGRELIAELQHHADRAGIPLLELARNFNRSNPSSFVRTVSMAARPRASTVLRVRALIAGEDIAASFGEGEGEIIELPARAAVFREPCFRCGVRGDIGCGHVRAPA